MYKHDDNILKAGRWWVATIVKVGMAVVCCFLIPQKAVLAQQKKAHLPAKDSAWVTDFRKTHLVVRLYESTKYNNFRFTHKGDRVIYDPNEHNNIGIGFTYKFISLNLGAHVAIADKDYQRYGRTRQFDLQSHLYFSKLIVDIYAQYYKGFYLVNPEKMMQNFTPNSIIKRPDINTIDLSASVQYVFNHRKFSYAAPFHQNELQKKSAGSWLAGAGIYNSAVVGDSAIIGDNLTNSEALHSYKFRRAATTGIGFNAGYGYTRVIGHKFFATGTATGGAGLAASRLYMNDSTFQTRGGPLYNLNLVVAGGYNYGAYYVGMSYIRLITVSSTPLAGMWQEANRGNIRVNIARRFPLRRYMAHGKILKQSKESKQHAH